MALTVTWLRLELGRRWQPLLVLVLLVAVSTGAFLTCAAGARRGASAPDRLLEASLPATAVVHTNQEAVNYWPRIRALPGVAAVSTFPAYSGFSVDEAPGDPVGAYLPLDAEAMRTVERPVVLAGRLADPARADEAVVTARFVDVTGRGVGSTVTVRLFTARQVNTGVSAVRTTAVPKPRGPAIRTRIVGVVRSPFFSDDVESRGRLIPSPALAAAYPTNVLGADRDSEQWGLVRLTAGDGGLPALRRQLTAMIPSTPGADLVPRSEAVAHWRSVTRFQAGCLLGLAAAVLLAAAFVVGTAVTRQVAAVQASLRPLVPLGMTPTQMIVLSVLGPVFAGVLGAAAGLALATAGSRLLPFGVAATLEPHPGVDLDLLVLGPGAALAALAVSGWALLIGWFMQRLRPLSPRASSVARGAARSGLPVPVVMGLRHALETGTGRAAIPVRSALVGAVIGVLGVAGGLTFAAGVDDAAASPQRFGQWYGLEVAFGYSGTDLTCAAAAERVLAQDPAVRSMVDLRFQTAQLTGVSGGSDRTVTVFGAARGDGDPVLTRGRPAIAPDDVVLAPTTARRLGARLGSKVPIQGQLPDSAYGPTGQDVPASDPCTGPPDYGVGPPAGGTIVPGQRTTALLTVSGIGFVPQTQYNEYDTGAWVSAATYRNLFGDGFVNHEMLVGLVPGAVPAQVAARVGEQFREIPGSAALFTAEPTAIQRSGEIGALRSLPLLLCVFLAVLALAATGHVLLVSARRRRGEVAILRALGMSRRQSRAVPATQAGVYAVVGLLFGLPLGVAAGRVLWRLVSDQTPLAYRAPLDGAGLGLTVLATVLAVQLLALPAARRHTRSRVAEVLRAE